MRAHGITRRATNLAPQVDGALEVENVCEQGDRQRSLDTLRRLGMSYGSVRRHFQQRAGVPNHEQESTRRGSIFRRDDGTCERTERRKRVSSDDLPKLKEIGTPEVEQSQWGSGFSARRVGRLAWTFRCERR